MHDVGKIGISDEIMLKPGKLSDDEYFEMQRHVEIGAEILEGHDSEVLRIAYEIALTHHEKYNGKGYPKGLMGEDIPISGRIVAIADVFDALTSERPYKKPGVLKSGAPYRVRERRAFRSLPGGVFYRNIAADSGNQSGVCRCR